LIGLKILIVCFEKQLSTEWHRISKCITDLGTSQMGWQTFAYLSTILNFHLVNKLILIIENN